MTWRACALGLVVLAFACRHPQVKAFDVKPQMACPGQEVLVTWDVDGAARLRAERGASDWDEELVMSTGSRKVVPATSTKFTITALDANAALGNSYGTKEVTLPKLADERRTHDNACDATTRSCSGVFTLETATGSVHVKRLSAPRITQAGKTRPAAVFVTHDGLPKTPLQPDQPLSVDVLAAGEWKVEAELDVPPTEPPPAFTVLVDFACP